MTPSEFTQLSDLVAAGFAVVIFALGYMGGHLQ